MTFFDTWRLGSAFLMAAVIVFILGRPVVAFLHSRKIGQKIQQYFPKIKDQSLNDPQMNKQQVLIRSFVSKR